MTLKASHDGRQARSVPLTFSKSISVAKEKEWLLTCVQVTGVRRDNDSSIGDQCYTEALSEVTILGMLC